MPLAIIAFKELAMYEIVLLQAMIAAQRATLGVGASISSIPVAGWIIGGTVVAATLALIAAISQKVSAWEAVQSSINSGRYSEALEKLGRIDSSKKETVIRKLMDANISCNEYRQADSRWASIKLSNRGETMRAVGCYITSMASALNHKGAKIGGFSIDPKDLAEYLLSKNLIDSDGCLKAAAFRDFGFELESDRSYSFDRAMAAHLEGKIVIIEVSPTHFMLMTGIDKDCDIKLMDPAGSRTWIRRSEVKGLRIYKRT